MANRYDATSLDGELRAAGLPIRGCASDGRIDWVSPPTPAQTVAAEAVKATHDPDRRRREAAAEQAAVAAAVQRLRAAAGTPALADLRDVLLWLYDGPGARL